LISNSVAGRKKELIAAQAAFPLLLQRRLAALHPVRRSSIESGLNAEELVFANA
jgi:hypothetical protein